MLDNTALTIILVALNVIWLFVLTATVLFAYATYKELTAYRKSRKYTPYGRYSTMPPPDPKTGLNYQRRHRDPVDVVNSWNYPDN